MGFAYPTSFPVDEAQGCADFLAGTQTDPFVAIHDQWALDGYVKSQAQAAGTPPIAASAVPCSKTDAVNHLRGVVAQHKGSKSLAPIPWLEILAAIDAALQSLLGGLPAMTAPASKVPPLPAKP